MTKPFGRRRTAALVVSVLTLAVAVTATVSPAGASRADVLEVHGYIVALVGLALLWLVLPGYFAPLPKNDRTASYYDDPTRAGVILAMIWAVLAMMVGDWVAWLLAYPQMTFDFAWASFGRLRPVHTTGVIFGFGGNALIATSFHVMQRTSRARMAGDPPDVTVGPRLHDIGLFEFHRAKEAIDLGTEATENALGKISEAVESLRERV